MLKSITLTLTALVLLGVGIAAHTTRQQSQVQAAAFETNNAESQQLSESLAQQTQEKAKAEDLLLNLRSMRELLARQISDTYAERDNYDSKFAEVQAHIDAAIALDNERMKDVDEQVQAFTDRILALTDRINKAVKGSSEYERLITELARMNKEVDEKTDQAKTALDELNTRQDNLRLTLNALSTELETEKGRAETREREASGLLEDVRKMQTRVAALKFNIRWYENRRTELQKIIAAKRAMARIKATIKGPFGISVRPQDLVLGPMGAGLPTIKGGGSPPIEIGPPGGGLKIGGRKIF